MQDPHTPVFSVVVPIYNEAGNIVDLDREIKSAMARMDAPKAEIIYVDDGSTDGSTEELLSLKGVTIITMNRNYGQATALDAGFKHASGDLIVSLDGDGQNDPADIERLYQKLKDEHLDVVCGWRKDRMDSKGINTLTLVGRAFRRFLMDDVVHDSGCTLRIYTKDAAQSLDIGGEMHRYILALLRWKGFSVGEVVVTHRARVHGVSKYNYSKAIRGLIDLLYIWFIYKFSQRPLHLFGYVSVGAMLLGAISGLHAVYDKIVFGLPFNRSGWFFSAGFLILSGIMFFSFGIVIDLLIRTYLNSSPNEKRYYTRNVVIK